mmetsp:Transcript_44978/g.144117  ORF Transcript_44978/g.144117 Transcript_44978/m.144117 type:complete len:222 (+) Transcript_44978:196-861(+)
MIGQDVIFDLNKGRLGLAPADCPSFVKRPAAPSRPISLPVPPGKPAASDKPAASGGGWMPHGGGAMLRWTQLPATPLLQGAALAALLLLALCGVLSLVRNLRAADAQARTLATAAAASAAAAGEGASGGGGAKGVRRKRTSLSASPPAKRSGEESGERSPAPMPLHVWLTSSAPGSASATGSDSAVGHGPHSAASSDASPSGGGQDGRTRGRSGLPTRLQS